MIHAWKSSKFYYETCKNEANQLWKRKFLDKAMSNAYSSLRVIVTAIALHVNCKLCNKYDVAINLKLLTKLLGSGLNYIIGYVVA